jgi:hypothetical protein
MRVEHRLVIAAIFAFSSCHSVRAKEPSFSVYCVSNMDGTGHCRRDDNNELITCVAIPGGVIQCFDKKSRLYECVNYGITAAADSQLSFACDYLDIKNNSEAAFGDKPVMRQAPSMSSSSDDQLNLLLQTSTQGKHADSVSPTLSPVNKPANPFGSDNNVF